VFPKNAAKGSPSINGAVCLFSDTDGTLDALIDFHLVTKWKTAADSLLAARKLAPAKVREILIVGAGTVGQSLIEAFSAGFPDAAIHIWNRDPVRAEARATQNPGVQAAADLPASVSTADIVVCATMATAPVLKGAWLRPGQHINLIGAYRPDMREADDEALGRSRLYVDSFDTTLDHIGELRIPLETGVIMRDAILADFYDLARFTPSGPDDITLFKNGGGAHLDLMTSRYILDRWQAS
jgi:ornithine cyclodeaminase